LENNAGKNIDIFTDSVINTMEIIWKYLHIFLRGRIANDNYIIIFL